MVTNVNIESPYYAQNIQSMQAQMMGLYPGSNLNTLNERQQVVAVPPTAHDYTQWQEELGEQALPFGLNTFPIFQTGRASDFVLATSVNNCPLFASLFNAAQTSVESTWTAQALSNGSYNVETLLKDNTIEEVCEYATWAFNSSYDLVSQADEVEYMRTSICPGYYSNINTAFAEIDATN